MTLRFSAAERDKTKRWLSNRAKNLNLLYGAEAGYEFRDALNIIRDLEAEVARLDKLAYFRIRLPWRRS